MCILHIFLPTEVPWGSLHAAILHCQAPNPLSVLFHKATAIGSLQSGHSWDLATQHLPDLLSCLPA